VAGMLAGRMVSLSLGGGEVPLPEPTVQQDRVRQLQEGDFQVILDRNLFNSQAVGTATEQVDLSLANVPGKEQPASKSAGELALIGTVVAGKNSLALIQVGRKVAVYRLDAELATGVVLIEVERNKVAISDHGVRRELILKLDNQESTNVARLPGRTDLINQRSQRNQAGQEGQNDQNSGGADDGIVALGNNRWQISRGAAENARSNFNSLLSTARMIPQVENGQTVGFRLLEIKKGTLLEKIGLQVGDVLVQINDVVLDSPEKALQVFQQVREASNISLGLIRNGDRQTFEYGFE